MADYQLRAQVREEAGKNRVDKLREAGDIPAVVYQKNEEPLTVKVSSREFAKVYAKAGTSALVDLDVEGTKKTVLIKEVQMHPYKDLVLHIDFQGVRMDEKIKVTVPVVLVGRDEIRVQPSVLMQMLDEVEVECLPAEIPASAEVNVEEMQIGDVITVKDLDIAQNDKITLLTDAEEPIASLNEPQEESATEETEGVEAGDVPEIGKEDEATEE